MNTAFVPLRVPLGVAASTKLSPPADELIEPRVAFMVATSELSVLTDVVSPDAVVVTPLTELVRVAIELVLPLTVELRPVTVELRPVTVVVSVESEVVLPLTVVDKPVTVLLRLLTVFVKAVIAGAPKAAISVFSVVMDVLIVLRSELKFVTSLMLIGRVA